MGGVNTKEADEESPPMSGVQVSAGLIRQLEGETVTEPQNRPIRRGGPSWLPHIRPAGSPQTSDSPRAANQGELAQSQSQFSQTGHISVQDDDLVQTMLQEKEQIHQQASPREIRAEAASQQEVNEYADQLVKEYEVPLKALPCQDEKTECLLCYQSNQENPLQCAAQVDAFTKCARKASAIMVK